MAAVLTGCGAADPTDSTDYETVRIQYESEYITCIIFDDTTGDRFGLTCDFPEK